MEYNQFKEWLKSELPINRKERFYTGTILPSMLFYKGLSNFYRFLREIEHLPTDINQENTKDSFLFYTEYNLKESAGKKSVGAEIYTLTRDTPDVIIEILEPQKVFIAIEGKMYANLTQNDLGKQMTAQKHAVIDILRNKYDLDNTQTFHIALTPKQLGFKTTTDYQVINWEFFIDNEDIDLQGNYFSNFLRFALEHYDKLVSDQPGKAPTVEDKIPGIDIYRDGTGKKILWVGRKGGKKAIEEDVRKGIWRDKLYCVNTEKPRAGQKGNWLSSQEFVEIVGQKTKGFALLPKHWYACEFIGDFFRHWEDICSYSPIRIDGIEPLDSKNGTFLSDFYHANYPEGVKDKSYKLKILERGDSFVIAKSLEHEPVRILQIYEIDLVWISRHFPEAKVDRDDIQGWLDRNA